MTEEKQTKQEKKSETEILKKSVEVKPPVKADAKSGAITEEKQTKQEKKSETEILKKPKKNQSTITKKEEAKARGVALPISKKHAMYICNFIKGKTIDGAISDLQDVIKFKRAVPFKGEIPHRKGKIMSGRYPVKASGYFINMLKALKGNVIVNGMDLDKSKIINCSANWAPRPQMSGGARFKRTHVILIAKEIKTKEKNK